MSSIGNERREFQVLRAVFDMVPQWYEGEIGPDPQFLVLSGCRLAFCSLQPFSPRLYSLLEYIRSHLAAWEESLPQTPTPSAIRKIQEELALRWLATHHADIGWGPLIAFAEHVRYRTHENIPVTMNLVLRPGQGRIDLTDRSILALIDPLASSRNICFDVDYQLRFLDYRRLEERAGGDTEMSGLVPEFLQVFRASLQEQEFSFHITPRGDLIFMDAHGMIASCRKGRWHLYDVSSLREGFTRLFSSPNVADSLLSVLFDLSYRRHGALLVYDPEHQVLEHVVNRSSVLVGSTAEPDDARQMLAPAAATICLDHEDPRLRHTELLMELAAIDGAVLFDRRGVTAFGAMIESHPQVGSHVGARKTAGRSAALWGGVPLMISADGEMAVHFISRGPGGRESPARLRFL